MSYRVRSLLVGSMVIDGATEPVHAWLVEGEGRKVLVDVGMPSKEVTEARWRTETLLGGAEALRAELAQHGASPDDVEAVILTHLHFDHAWNLDLFPHAVAVVQRSELIHALDPVPTHRTHYARDVNVAIAGRRKPAQLRVVDGDLELFPGLRLMHIPGHTPGMMGVLVMTERGVVGLPSDAGETYANWYPADPVANPRPINFLRDSFLPPHVYTEAVATSVASMQRFAAAADIVIPSHDPRIPKRVPEEWFAIPSPGVEVGRA
jgi:N-acyl homoserine lactone hydrolase